MLRSSLPTGPLPRKTEGNAQGDTDSDTRNNIVQRDADSRADHNAEWFGIYHAGSCRMEGESRNWSATNRCCLNR
ncbi:hypothetical protein MES5069_250119 [Mesorhizobium escarrei]|uniref:Uncharacterized protein n=1 Tax=Mesorhizobium escarrei TaxID=666018 RepID=A0ABM9DUI1_9HYPH|nr:hypothetical protein MES5069_250119 [Mesorhizobium escarrei]